MIDTGIIDMAAIFIQLGVVKYKTRLHFSRSRSHAHIATPTTRVMARISEKSEQERKPEATSRPDIREHVVIGQYLVESIRKKKEVFKD